MKTMKDFAAQQLSKKQMNQVRGGQNLYECSFTTATGTYVQYVYAENKIMAEAEVQFSGTDVDNVNCN